MRVYKFGDSSEDEVSACFLQKRRFKQDNSDHVHVVFHRHDFQHGFEVRKRTGLILVIDVYYDVLALGPKHAGIVTSVFCG